MAKWDLFITLLGLPGWTAGKIDMDDDLTMLIGLTRDGTPLEIGVLDLNGEDPVVIHAMRLRPKFYPLVRQG